MAANRPQLRIIEGDLSQSFPLAGFQLHICDIDARLPLSVEAQIVEQDTAMLLEEPTQIDATLLQHNEGEGYHSLINEMLHQQRQYEVGSIALREGTPERIMLVVHDLNQSPSWSEAGIKQALNTLFALLPRYRFNAIALPTLAHRHGKLPVERFLALLCEQMRERPPLWGGDIWIQVPREALASSVQTLQRLSQ